MNMGNSTSKNPVMNDNNDEYETGNGTQRKSTWTMGFSKIKHKQNKHEENNNQHPKLITSTSHAIDEHYSGQVMAAPLENQMSAKSANHPSNLPITPNRSSYTNNGKHAPFSPSYKLRLTHSYHNNCMYYIWHVCNTNITDNQWHQQHHHTIVMPMSLALNLGFKMVTNDIQCYQCKVAVATLK